MNEFVFLDEMNNGVRTSYPTSSRYTVVLPSGNVLTVQRNRNGYTGYSVDIASKEFGAEEIIHATIPGESKLYWEYIKNVDSDYRRETGDSFYVEDCLKSFCREDEEVIRRVIASLRSRVKYTGFLNKTDDFVMTSGTLAFGAGFFAAAIGIIFALIAIFGGWGLGTAAMCIVFSEMIIGVIAIVHCLVSKIARNKKYWGVLEHISTFKPGD